MFCKLVQFRHCGHTAMPGSIVTIVGGPWPEKPNSFGVSPPSYMETIDVPPLTVVKAGEQWTVTRRNGDYIWMTRNNRKKERGLMFKEIGSDVRTYISENRDLVYTIILVLLVDQFIFEGALRDRLKNLVESFMRRAEAKCAPVTVDTVPTRVV